MKKKLALHWQILLGIVLGVLFGVLLSQFSWGKDFAVDWIKPFGTIFINLLKLIAIPLIITSLITGIANLKDLTQLSSMGSKTFVIYMITTLIALAVGLGVVNSIRPGDYVSEQTRVEMQSQYEDVADAAVQRAEEVAANRGPLQPLVDIVPENIFGAVSSNVNMLQVILFTILCGVALMMIPKERSEPLVVLFNGAADVILKIVDMIMRLAPIGVFGLMLALVVEIESPDVFVALGMYSLTVVFGLLILLYVIYATIIKVFGGMSPLQFYKKILPAKLVGFSTSSSAATLPVTTECVEERLGVDKKISGFVLPIGATVNMDGTCMYQAVAAVFIAQVTGHDLSLVDQLTIVLTATLASIGSAPVPGAGMIMLVIVLESIGVDPASIFLILAVDRPLDMCRTVVNISGDAMIALVVNKRSGYKLEPTVET